MAIIDEIKEAEEKARKLKDDAREAARADAEAIETEARKKAADMKSKAEAQASKAEAEAEAEAKAFTEQAKKESDRQCEELKESGRVNINAAIELIYKGALDI